MLLVGRCYPQRRLRVMINFVLVFVFFLLGGEQRLNPRPLEICRGAMLNLSHQSVNLILSSRVSPAQKTTCCLWAALTVQAAKLFALWLGEASIFWAARTKAVGLPVLLPVFASSQWEYLLIPRVFFSVYSVFYAARTPTWGTPRAAIALTRGTVTKSHLCLRQFVCGGCWTQPIERENVFLVC